MANDPSQTTEEPMTTDDWAVRCGKMQHTIDELHKALWCALHDAGGEIVVTADEMDAMPPLGRIEWLHDQSKTVLVIRAVEGKSGDAR